ncbi:MAG: hydrogenase formation protein HypD [Candidatus Hodarchaeales archaeon]|jgi:hydrogenase expression/formation protein HypD
MKSYQDPELINRLREKISDIANKIEDKIKICHVCGTHEFTISHWGIRSLLPKNVEVIAGPGCPVCVCPNEDIEQAIWLAKNGYTLATFGDMTRVPSNQGSLLTARAEGASIQIVYSFLDVIKLARSNPSKKVVFFAIGFETTAPIVAIELLNENIPSNLSILSSHRLVPPAMYLLLEQPDIQVDGFIAPGHVSAITGSGMYEPISSKHQVPIVIAGFEPADVMFGILEVLKQLASKQPRTENLYQRVVTQDGNTTALSAMDTAYSIVDAKWRGIGEVPLSGLELAETYSSHNIRKIENIPISKGRDIPKGCRCADVILGKIYPEKCSLFNTVCTPEKPVGPCMVGTEGTCAIHAKYGGYLIINDDESE